MHIDKFKARNKRVMYHNKPETLNSINNYSFPGEEGSLGEIWMVW